MCVQSRLLQALPIAEFWGRYTARAAGVLSDPSIVRSRVGCRSHGFDPPCGQYREKPVLGAVLSPRGIAKLLKTLASRRQVPYATEPGINAAEQGT